MLGSLEEEEEELGLGVAILMVRGINAR